MIKSVFAVSFACALLGAFAAIEPIDPVGGKAVALLPAEQKKVMSLPTLEKRLEFFAKENVSGRKARKQEDCWRRAVPVDLKWRATSGEKGPWKVMIGKTSDLSDARVWYVSAHKIDKATGRETGEIPNPDITSFEVPLANLEIGTHYYWQVVCRGYCGFGCGPKHGCKASKKVVLSSIAEFTTEDLAPRWIAIEGTAGNIRDLGGRRAGEGRRVKQGMVYRGQGLNSNSVTGEEQGRNRLTVEDVKYFTKTLGIKTDLDLRGRGETADLAESPLGPSVKLIIRPSWDYARIFTDPGKKVMAANFREFCDRANYPIYFHCIGGADRTGALAYVLNGVLGVDRHELETDWESTFYPRIPDANPDRKSKCRESHFNDGFARYGKEDDSWNQRIELYLLDCGVKPEEIETFRNIMLEESVEKVD